MTNFFRSRTLRAALLALSICLGTTGCLSAKMYVDPALPVASRADLPVVAEPQPVQMLFEFRTRGGANAKATAEIRPRAVAVASESGLFSTVTSTPATTGGGVLKVVVDNIVLDDNAAAKGFGTGLTFGLVGSMVTDGYVCTASYAKGDKKTETTVRHALHTTIGNHAGPPGLVALEPQAAVHKVMDQLVWNALKQLAEQGAFAEEPAQ